MLTADLVKPRLRLRGSELFIDMLNTGDPHWLQTATDLITLFQQHRGQSMADWDSVLETYEGERLDYVVVRGLAKVLTDAATFTPLATTVRPAQIREHLFSYGPVFNTPQLFQPRTQYEVIQHVADEIGIPSQQVAAMLFADRPATYALNDTGPEWTPGSLLSRYNLELARGVLYWATQVQIEVHGGYKDLWKFLKLFKLMFWVLPFEPADAKRSRESSVAGSHSKVLPYEPADAKRSRESSVAGSHSKVLPFEPADAKRSRESGILPSTGPEREALAAAERRWPGVKEPAGSHSKASLQEDGYLIDLDGPISPFVSATTRYGRQFAAFLPALFLCERWRMVAMVRAPQTGAMTTYRLDYTMPFQTYFKQSGLFDSRLEADFASEFEQKMGGKRGHWVLRRESEVLVLGDTVMIPDFTLIDDEDETRKILIELVGFWHPEYLRRKVEKVRAANCQHLLLLVYRGLNLAGDAFEGTASEVVFFSQKPVLKEVMETVEEMAERIYGRRRKSEKRANKRRKPSLD